MNIILIFPSHCTVTDQCLCPGQHADALVFSRLVPGMDAGTRPYSCLAHGFMILGYMGDYHGELA